MPKVYFRASNGKAIIKDTDWDVNYDQSLDIVSSSFKISKSNVKLVYNGETKTANFKLNPELPHHIIHVKDNSKIAKDDLKINVVIDDGVTRKELKDVPVKSKDQIKNVVSSLLPQKQLLKENTDGEGPKIFHEGTKLNENESFLDNGFQDNGTLTVVQLREDWPGQDQGFPDPSDVSTCATLLKQAINDVFVQTAMDPQFASIATDLVALKNGKVIVAFQQEYEKQRYEVLYSPYPPYLLKPGTY